MAYPTFYPFKTKYYSATALSSNATASCPVVARGKLMGVSIAPIGTNQTATGSFQVNLNGSSVAGTSSIAATTGVAGVISYTGAPTTTTYVNPGDVLSTVASSCVATISTYIVREF